MASWLRMAVLVMTVIPNKASRQQVGTGPPAPEEAVVVLAGGTIALRRVRLVPAAVPVPRRRDRCLHGAAAERPDGERVVEVRVAVVAVARVDLDLGGELARHGEQVALDGVHLGPLGGLELEHGAAAHPPAAGQPDAGTGEGVEQRGEQV